VAVVRVDDRLLREIKKFLQKDGNCYRHPSVSAFINYALYEKIIEINGKSNKKRKRR
jgi:predicted nucleotide-binding protein (sugar kinase/HSP70/actin superfamily)